MNKTYIINSFIIIFCVCSFLFSPKPDKFYGPNSQCPITYISLNRYMGFPMNCDAIEFTGASVNPSYLFSEKFNRQSRPLYTLTGYIIGNVLYFITTPLHPAIEKKIRDNLKHMPYSSKEINLKMYLFHYIGLVSINFFVLLFSCILLSKTIYYFSGSWKNSSILHSLLMLSLISNFITKKYFWTPHQQMFTILMPLLCIFIAITISSPKINKKKLYLINFLCGTLLLFYGNFLLLLPTIYFSIIYKFISDKRKPFSYVLMVLTKSTFLYFSPLICWITILKISGIEFVSSEVSQFRQFIWIIDAANENNTLFTSKIVSQFFEFIKTFGALIAPLVLLLCFFLMSKNSKFKDKEKSIFFKNFLIFYFLSAFIFLFAVGYYADRLTYILSPLIIAIISIRINGRKISQLNNFILCVLLILFHIFILFNEMPHFSDRYYF